MTGFFGRLRDAVSRYDDTHNFTCDLCMREVFSGERVCAACRAALPYNNGAVCPFCGRRVREEGVCTECKREPIGVSRARSLLLYEGEAMRLVARYKRGERYLFRTACELCLPLLRKEFPDADAFAYVPMTARAERARGYNQSRLLCERLAQECGKDVVEGLVKTRDTGAQKALGRSERAENLRGCFRVTDRGQVEGKKVVIIDDTLTTGATVSELARTLKQAGAADVFAFTLTSVENKTPFGKKNE